MGCARTGAQNRRQRLRTSNERSSRGHAHTHPPPPFPAGLTWAEHALDSTTIGHAEHLRGVQGCRLHGVRMVVVKGAVTGSIGHGWIDSNARLWAHSGQRRPTHHTTHTHTHTTHTHRTHTSYTPPTPSASASEQALNRRRLFTHASMNRHPPGSTQPRFGIG